MPAIDHCHQHIVRALEKVGWIVEPRPFTIAIKRGRSLQIDIEAHRINEDNEETLIVVEAKCFPTSRADTDELYGALGQYIVYRSLLRQRTLAGQLYLAVPKHAYEDVFQRIGMSAVVENGIKLIIVDMEKEELEQWLI